MVCSSVVCFVMIERTLLSLAFLQLRNILVQYQYQYIYTQDFLLQQPLSRFLQMDQAQFRFLDNKLLSPFVAILLGILLLFVKRPNFARLKKAK